MHARKRPLVFVDMAKTLLDEGLDARFTLVGPDEGEGSALRTALKDDPRISWEGALDPAEIPQRMAAASIYVLPSVREPYPMSVLEAMSVGLPVVVSRRLRACPSGATGALRHRRTMARCQRLQPPSSPSWRTGFSLRRWANALGRQRTADLACAPSANV